MSLLFFLKIKKFNFRKFADIFSRLLGIICRYVFILIFSRYFSTELFSNFNLFSSLVLYLVFFGGFDYYNHLHKNYHRNKFIFNTYLNSYFFLSIIGVFLGSLLSYYFYKDFGNFSLIGPILFLICISELFLQESYRLEVLKGKIIYANFFALLRYLWMPIYIFFNKNIEFNFVDLIQYWAVINFMIAIFIMFIYYNPKNKISFHELNLDVVKESILAILPLFLSTLVLRGFFLFDRWSLQFFGSSDMEIAKFSLIALFGAGFSIFIDTVVINYYYPLLFKLDINDKYRYNVTVKLFFIKISFVAFLGSIGFFIIHYCFGEILFGGYHILYSELFLALLTQYFYNISIIPNLVLVNLSKYRIILFVNFTCFLIFVSSLILFNFISDGLNTSYIFLSLSLSFFFLFFIKSIILKKHGYKIY